MPCKQFSSVNSEMANIQSPGRTEQNYSKIAPIHIFLQGSLESAIFRNNNQLFWNPFSLVQGLQHFDAHDWPTTGLFPHMYTCTHCWFYGRQMPAFPETQLSTSLPTGLTSSQSNCCLYCPISIFIWPRWPQGHKHVFCFVNRSISHIFWL